MVKFLDNIDGNASRLGGQGPAYYAAAAADVGTIAAASGMTVNLGTVYKFGSMVFCPFMATSSTNADTVTNTMHVATLQGTRFYPPVRAMIPARAVKADKLTGYDITIAIDPDGKLCAYFKNNAYTAMVVQGVLIWKV